MIKPFFALLPVGAISDYLFHSAIYLHSLRGTFLMAMDQLSSQFLPG